LLSSWHTPHYNNQDCPLLLVMVVMVVMVVVAVVVVVHLHQAAVRATYSRKRRGRDVEDYRDEEEESGSEDEGVHTRVDVSVGLRVCVREGREASRGAG
jgi:hypothetical protein